MTRLVKWDGITPTDCRLVELTDQFGWQVKWTNVALNPSFEDGATSPSNVPSTGTMDMSATTESPWQGSRSLRLTTTTTGGLSIPVTTALPVTGEVYTLIMHVRPKTKTLKAQPRIRANNGAQVTLPPDVWTEVRYVYEAGSGNSIQTGLTVSSTNGHAVGDIIDVDGVALVPGVYTGEYFDGSTLPAGTDSERMTSWEEAANASASLFAVYAPVEKPLSVDRPPTPSVIGQSAYHLREDGVSFFGKGEDGVSIPASTMKMFTLYVARLYITDSMLQDSVNIESGDMVVGSTAGFEPGDLTTWDALFHGSILASGNEAAHAIARQCGYIISANEGGPGGHSGFRAKANAIMASWGWEAAVFQSSSGLDAIGRISAKQLCELMFRLDDYSLQVAGTVNYTTAVTGPNPRTLNMTHDTIVNNQSMFPEMVGVKTGSLSDLEIASIVMISEIGGMKQATAVLKTWPASNRFSDTRVILDQVLAQNSL